MIISKSLPLTIRSCQHVAELKLTNILVVDYGNYPFIFDLARHWPTTKGLMSYAYASSQRGRNTEASNVRCFDNGGVVYELKATESKPRSGLIGRRRAEMEVANLINKILPAANPDVVIGANNPLDLQASVAAWCHANSRPFIFWLQDLRAVAMRSILNQSGSFLGKLATLHYQRMEQRLLKGSAHVISITEEFIPEIRKAGVDHKRISVIPNWAPIAQIPLNSRKNSWAQRHNLIDKRVVLYTGNLGMKHNPALLIRLCKATSTIPDVIVVVVSEGGAIEWLKAEAIKEAISNLLVLPFVQSDILPDVLATADVLVGVLEPEATSYSVPSKTWTYLSAGKPIVMSISQDNQAARILNKIGAGICCDPRDPSAFVSTAIQLLNLASGERESIGANGRNFAELNFSQSHIVKRFSNCIECAIETFGSPRKPV